MSVSFSDKVQIVNPTNTPEEKTKTIEKMDNEMTARNLFSEMAFGTYVYNFGDTAKSYGDRGAQLFTTSSEITNLFQRVIQRDKNKRIQRLTNDPGSAKATSTSATPSVAADHADPPGTNPTQEQSLRHRKPPFHSREIKKVDREAPQWLENKTARERFADAVPLIGGLIGLIIAGFLVWSGVRIEAMPKRQFIKALCHALWVIQGQSQLSYAD